MTVKKRVQARKVLQKNLALKMGHHNPPSIPLHLGIILDGNRRWAKNQNLPSLEGHRRGLDNIRQIARQAFDRGVKIITVFAFSTENWQRDPKEVAYLLRLFRLFIGRESRALFKKGISLKFFGRLRDFDADIRASIKGAEKTTEPGQRGRLNVCLSYGGRDEIVRAVQKIVRDKIPSSKISEATINDRLDSAGLPDPDLIIRTSGEQRLSGFLTWQSVYSEIYFTKKHWPDFRAQDLDAAFSDYARRQRRFGAN